MAIGQGTAGNVIAALVNVFVPGLGQLLQGRLLPAILFFILIVTGYALWFLLIPAILAGLLHLWCILDAAIWKPR
jgi:TM2 domain-containing membrane protein YozV